MATSRSFLNPGPFRAPWLTGEMMDRERYTCTPEAPWTPDKGAAEHPGAEYLGDDIDGCCDRYHCPNCGLNFRVRLPSH